MLWNQPLIDEAHPSINKERDSTIILVTSMTRHKCTHESNHSYSDKETKNILEHSTMEASQGKAIIVSSTSTPDNLIEWIDVQKRKGKVEQPIKNYGIRKELNVSMCSVCMGRMM